MYAPVCTSIRAHAIRKYRAAAPKRSFRFFKYFTLKSSASFKSPGNVTAEPGSSRRPTFSTCLSWDTISSRRKRLRVNITMTMRARIARAQLLRQPQNLHYAILWFDSDVFSPLPRSIHVISSIDSLDMINFRLIWIRITTCYRPGRRKARSSFTPLSVLATCGAASYLEVYTDYCV